METMRILLADHHTLVRAGIKGLLEQINGVKVVAEAFDGKEAVDLSRKNHPDLVFMEVLLPHMNGLDATEEILKVSPKTKVLILSALAGEEYVAQAIQAGACGYIVKDAQVAELANAIKTVEKNEVYLSPSLARDKIVTPLTPDTRRRRALRRLTPRQKEILKLISEGNTTKEIARQLTLSPKTVEVHRVRIMDRLGIHDVPGLVRYAIHTGIIKM